MELTINNYSPPPIMGDPGIQGPPMPSIYSIRVYT